MSVSIGIITLLLCVNVIAAADTGGNDANMGYTISTTPGTGGGSFPSKPLVFSSIMFEPYLMENTDPNAQGNGRFIGFIPDLVKELATRLEFDYELRLVKDDKWGTRDVSTAKWNGMIGEVIRGEVDFAAAPITITDLRKSVVDFTVIFQDVSLTALIKAGSNLHNLEDLLQSNFTYGTIRSGSTSDALMGSRDMQINLLWSRIVSQSGMVETSEQGRQRAKEGNYAFILEKPIADYYVAADCDLQTVGDFYPQAGFAFPAQKSYRQLPNFNTALGALKRDGKIDVLVDKWWKPQPCSGSANVASAVVLLSSLLSFIFL